MTVRADKPMTERSLVGVIDEQAQATLRRAQDRLAPIVSAATPRGRTGKVAAALRPKVSKTKTGGALSVRAPRGAIHDRSATIADVVRWLNRGTGIYRDGPGAKKPIRPKQRFNPRAAMILPGGKRVRKVRGQKPNPFMDRIYTSGTAVVEATFAEGATIAAREAARGRG